MVTAGLAMLALAVGAALMMAAVTARGTEAAQREQDHEDSVSRWPSPRSSWAMRSGCGERAQSWQELPQSLAAVRHLVLVGGAQLR